MRETDFKYRYHKYIKGLAIEMGSKNDKKLREYGLTTSQGMLLGCINRLEHEGKKISRRKLQEQMVMSGPSVTSLLNGLERKAFIIRSAGAEDARTFQINVTEKGKRLQREMGDVFLLTEEQMMRGFSVRERMLLLELLERGYRNLHGENQN